MLSDDVQAEIVGFLERLEATSLDVERKNALLL
jgi:hypothetical protein